MHIQRLFIYPIKSLLPIEVSSAEITPTGFKYDRQYVLIKDPGAGEVGENEQRESKAPVAEHLTIKTMSKLCLFQPSIDLQSNILSVKHKITADEIKIPLTPTTASLKVSKEYAVTIFGTTACGLDMGAEAADFFSNHLQQKAKLLYIGNSNLTSSERLGRDIPAPALIPRKLKKKPRTEGLLSWVVGNVDEDHCELHQQKISFADAAPLLLTTTASEEDARSRLPLDARCEDVITRFRSNIHVGIDPNNEEQTSTKAYVEENWKTVTIRPKAEVVDEINDTTQTNQTADSRQVTLDLVFNSVRCMSLNVDFETGGIVTPERQLYKLLVKDRRVNPAFPFKPCFGRYAFAEPFGTVVRVGDIVTVKEMVLTEGNSNRA